MSFLDKLLGFMLIVVAIPVLAFSLVLIAAWIAMIFTMEAATWLITKEWRKT